MSGEEDGELLAAELALGLLDDAGRQEALARLDTDPAFARLHGLWQARAASLMDGFEIAPRPEVWRSILSRLPANDDRRIVRHAGQRRWQLATAASMVGTVLLGIVALHRPDPPSPVVVQQIQHITMVAVLTGKGAGAVAVTYDATAKRLITAPAGLQVAGRSAQLWAIPAGGKPVSLGLVPDAGSHAAVPSQQAMQVILDDVTLAVSIEPRGGSRTGQPTGPVILTGKITTS